MENCVPYVPPEASVSTTSAMSMPSFTNTNQRSQKRKSVMPESPVPTNEVILNDKSQTSESPFQITRSSKTLVPVSTTNGKASSPFWNAYTKELSEKSWLPTRTGCVAMDLSSLSSSSRRLTQGSWFSVDAWKSMTPHANLPTTSSQSATISWQKITECVPPRIDERENKKRKKKKKEEEEEEKDEKEPAGKTKKIRLFPSPMQRATLMNWFGTTRWTYNQCLTAIEKEKTPWNKKVLRAKCLNAELFQQERQWVLQTPYDVRDEGMNDLLKAYKTNFAVQKKKGGGNFKIKYRSKRSESESIVIHAKHWKKAGVFHPKAFGKEPIRAAEPLPDQLTYDCRLKKTRLGEFYLCLLMPLELKGDNQAPMFTRGIEEGIIALDPGVRTFMTGYSPSGLAIEWGKKDIGRIHRLCRTLDELQSKWTQKDTRHRKRYRLQRAARRTRRKIRNLVDELHKKLVKWLVENYHTILLPKFETQKMCLRRASRRIGSKTARAMLTWSHYRFKQRLLDKMREYPWCNVIVCDEHYTSKTCGNCGFIHQTLGANKNFKCPQCHMEADRDIHAARNILLRYFTLHRAAPSGAVLGLTPLSP